jgi:hypothetical protein
MRKICGTSYSSEAHRTWEQTILGARCPRWHRLVIAAPREGEDLRQRCRLVTKERLTSFTPRIVASTQLDSHRPIRDVSREPDESICPRLRNR